ncbi:MAG: hypothetical protein BroJett003_10720 [Planctomycetota bacterium]|nr:MAG: hypothetical protein BroJett003_10720 [Planctomycetota bacterium]
MKRKRHGSEQVIRKLREADAELSAGRSIGEVCQKLEVSEATFHRWRLKYGGMKADDAKQLKNSRKRTSDSRSWWPGSGVR